MLWKVVTYSLSTIFNTIIKTNKSTIAETRLWDLKGSTCFILFFSWFPFLFFIFFFLTFIFFSSASLFYCFKNSFYLFLFLFLSFYLFLFFFLSFFFSHPGVWVIRSPVCPYSVPEFEPRCRWRTILWSACFFFSVSSRFPNFIPPILSTYCQSPTSYHFIVIQSFHVILQLIHFYKK